MAELASHGNVSQACQASRICRQHAYRIRNRNTQFRGAWDEAIETGLDGLEGEARRRAVEGWDEPVFGKLGPGQGTGQVGTVRKFSDTLLIFLLKGGRPEKYGERISSRIDVSKLSDEELRAITRG